MVGHTRTSDVKSRLGKRGFSDGKPKNVKIRDARDVLRGKVASKGRPSQAASASTKGRIRRLMPLADLLTKRKTVTYSGSSTKEKRRTLTLTSNSLRVTTKQPELCRQTIVSRNSLKVVTPTKTVDKHETSASVSRTTRTLTNDLYLKGSQSPFFSQSDNDLRTKPNLTFTTKETPIVRTSPGRQQQDTNHANLTKIVVTNLHPRVVQDDIAELFGAVGSLTSVKLDNCVAEVIFAKAVHAEIAYQKYHNRMLDGQAMKCTLGLANTPSEMSKTDESPLRMNYYGADLVYPQTPSRPVVFQVRI